LEVVSAAERPSAPAPLEPHHRLDGFDSGVSALDDWLKRRARGNETSGASRTFVAVVDDRVVGYYSLAATSIAHADAIPRARRNMPDPVPAILIGRLALDKSHQGGGYGPTLLRDAILRIAGAAGTIGVRAILVHAISDDAKRFYERFGFRASPLDPMTLMVTIEEAFRAMPTP
jgi:GNAT superfamily N-acetyltransferase